MPLISQEEILTITGYERPADAAACLRNQGVRVFVGKAGRIFTTTELFVAATERRQSSPQEVRFDGE